MVQKGKSHTIFDFSIFNTRNHIILIKPTINDDFSIQNIQNKIIISIPETKNILSSTSQTYIRNIIINTWKKEAQQFLLEG